MTTVYVSYSHRDAPTVQPIVNDLQQAGINVLIDYLVIRPGSNWEPQLEEAIRQADALLFVASPEAKSSQFSNSELVLARHINIPIFPVWVAGDDLSQCVPLHLLSHQVIDMRADFYSRGMDQLIEGLFTRFPHHRKYSPQLTATGFSSGYIAMFEHLLGDALAKNEGELALYVSNTLSLPDAVALEEQINGLCRRIILATPQIQEALATAQEEINQDTQLIYVSSFSHPGSTELVYVVAEYIANLDPMLQGVVLGLATNAIWDAMKASPRAIRFGVRIIKSHLNRRHSVIEELPDESLPEEHIEIPQPQLEVVRYAEMTLAELLAIHNYVGIRGGELVAGIERIESQHNHILR